MSLSFLVFAVLAAEAIVVAFSTGFLYVLARRIPKVPQVTLPERKVPREAARAVNVVVRCAAWRWWLTLALVACLTAYAVPWASVKWGLINVAVTWVAVGALEIGIGVGKRVNNVRIYLVKDVNARIPGSDAGRN